MWTPSNSENYPWDRIISAATPFLNEQRREKIEKVLENRIESISVAIESPADLNNALACIRTCEVLGITKIHIIEAEGSALHLKSISKGACDWIEIFYYDTFDSFLEKEKYDVLAGAVIDTKTIALNTLNLTAPMCILFGNENRGLSQKALMHCDILFHIPMFGMTQSLNLSVAAALAMYDTTMRKRNLLNQNGDLSLSSKNRLKALYYLNSLDQRFAEKLVNAK